MLSEDGHVSVKRPQEVHPKDADDGLQSRPDGDAHRRGPREHGEQRPVDDRGRHEPKVDRCKYHRADLHTILQVIPVGPRKCSHLEDTPQAGGVAGIPQDQHGLGIVEESTDALHPFLFEHGVLLVDANLVQKHPLLGPPEKEDGKKSREAKDGCPGRIEIGPTHHSRLQLHEIRQDVQGSQSHPNTAAEDAEEGCRRLVVVEQQHHDLQKGIRSPAVGPELVDLSGLEAQHVVIKGLCVSDDVFGRRHGLSDQGPPEAISRGPAIPQDGSKIDQWLVSPGGPEELR
mmetsp:Transcript_112934/g.269117  ORF Transcript_112934/g.269117 Transcript_112934/m.269117 type:complete len:287 (-) Transcript_112934:981-1841(-)